jgi:hypothetical protein
MRWCPPTIALVMIASLPVCLRAQSAQKWSLQLSGTGNVIFGESHTQFDADSGVGGEFQIRYTPGGLSLGLGAELAWHSSSAGSSGTPRFTGEDLDIRGVFLEPRLVAAASERAALYVSGRFAVSTIQVAENVGRVLCVTDPTTSRDEVECAQIVTNVTGDATGFTVNGGGGILVRVSERVNLDIGATVGLKDFGEAEFSRAEATDVATVKGDLGRFGNVVVRLGLGIGVGG